jgi:hypothetical protein
VAGRKDRKSMIANLYILYIKIMPDGMKAILLLFIISIRYIKSGKIKHLFTDSPMKIMLKQ